MIWVGFRHIKGVHNNVHNNVLVHVECYCLGLSDTAGCLAVVSYANVVDIICWG